jgi:hypothetical protein
MKDKKFIKSLIKILNTNVKCAGPANIKQYAKANGLKGKKAIKSFLESRFYVSKFD